MSKRLRVLMTGYEAIPFYKCGGLGDVVGSLPRALVEKRIDVKVVIPYYEEIRAKYNVLKIGELMINFGKGKEQISVYQSALPNTTIPIYFLSNRPILSHINKRGRNKRIDQFAFFSLAVANFILWLKTNKKWTPSIVHCNDWHTALVPLILEKEINVAIPTLLTIHNLGYQGWGSKKVLDLLHIKDENYKELKRGVAAKEINVLGEGILHSTRVSTVSPNYAQEIMDNKSNEVIYKYIRRRKEEMDKKGEITGILNGIDYEVWDPAKDKLINHNYDIQNWEAGKKANKEDLFKSLELEDKPIFCFIGRMATQKGLNILTKAIKRIVNLDVNIIILGTGDPNIEKSMQRIAQKYPKNIRIELAHNEELAHKLYASSDFILIPSHYEPCGLIQMVAMRYGTLPLASKTGGLKDSIRNNSNGFLFEKDKSRSLVKGIKRALKVYKNPSRYKTMVERAMKTSFAWEKSAKKYKRLYSQILSAKD